MPRQLSSGTPLKEVERKTARATPHPSLQVNDPAPARYDPPRPLKQVTPSAINLTSIALSGRTDVDVKVRIDEEGHVTEARVLSSKPYSNELLENAALAAAKEWIFEPAKMYGRSIASDHTIRFHFHSQLSQQ
jgi:TonB family protein